MVMRQLYLVGFAVLIMPGSVEQLVIPFILEPKATPNPPLTLILTVNRER